MRCYTHEEALAHIKGGGFPLDANGYPDIERKDWNYAEFKLELDAPRAFRVSQLLVQSLRPFDRCHLLVTAWDIFSKDSDLYLYYHLRRSLGDDRLLFEAPGHFFQGFEINELESIVFLGILAGWDMFAVPGPDYASWFISHDEYIRASFCTKDALDEFSKWIKPAK